MDRGDVLAFSTDDEKYKDWKYFRAIETLTKMNKDEDVKDTGSKLYLIGNVKMRDGKVEKHQELFIGDFFKMAQKGEANTADEAEQAIIFLTDTDF